MDKEKDLRIYNPVECAVFCKTADLHGGLSNMSAGFPLNVNGIPIRTSEALYQACRFPDHPDIQKNIINQVSSMLAKGVGKPYRETHTRKDWDVIRVMLMRWSLRVKLLQNWEKFSAVLLETGDLPIVELSTKQDDFWGAILIKEIRNSSGKKKMPKKYPPSNKMPVGSLVGYNVMGRLSTELRENIKTGSDELSCDFTRLKPLLVDRFWLYGKSIEEVLRR